jgi:hypothetical protein
MNPPALVSATLNITGETSTRTSVHPTRVQQLQPGQHLQPRNSTEASRPISSGSNRIAELRATFSRPHSFTKGLTFNKADHVEQRLKEAASLAESESIRKWVLTWGYCFVLTLGENLSFARSKFPGKCVIARDEGVISPLVSRSRLHNSCTIAHISNSINVHTSDKSGHSHAISISSNEAKLNN